MVFKAVGDTRPYPDHGLDARGWSRIPPRQVRLDQLVTTRRELYLEQGVHRALRCALHQRNSLHARVLDLTQ